MHRGIYNRTAEKLLELVEFAEEIDWHRLGDEDYHQVCKLLIPPLPEHCRSQLALGPSIDQSIILRASLERAMHFHWVSTDPDKRSAPYLSRIWSEAYKMWVIDRPDNDPPIDPALLERIVAEILKQSDFLLSKPEKAERLKKGLILDRRDLVDLSMNRCCRESNAPHLYRVYSALCRWTHPSPMGMDVMSERAGFHTKFRPAQPAKAAQGLHLGMWLLAGVLNFAGSLLEAPWHHRVTPFLQFVLDTGPEVMDAMSDTFEKREWERQYGPVDSAEE